MPNQIARDQQAESHGTEREDEAIPAASDEQVLEETTRLAREGRKELESDPKERKSPSE